MKNIIYKNPTHPKYEKTIECGSWKDIDTRFKNGEIIIIGFIDESPTGCGYRQQENK